MEEPAWSDWLPFAEAVAAAPRLPGVYMVRDREGDVVYIGMAGERRGGGKPQGLRGRLSIYATGKGLASGLGEAVFDRALADPIWVRGMLDDLDTDGPSRAKHWGIRAFTRAELEIRWTTTADRAAAAILEDRLVREAGNTLWNKASANLRAVTPRDPAAAPPTAVPPRRPGQTAMTQRVTSSDLAKGQIRIPIAEKSWFPTEPRTIDIILRGEKAVCKWNPKLDADRERSGTLRPPPDLLRRLVTPDERLVIISDGSQVALT